MALDDFKSRFPWYGPDLQTARNYLIPRPPTFSSDRSQRIEIPTNDGTGDVLLAMYERPPSRTQKPLILLIHGLAGCQDSFYMLNSARFWLARDHPVLRINLRGAGPSRLRCTQQYHAGRSDVPTLMLHARNDPWIPVSQFEAAKPVMASNVKLIVSNGGGHVGFHAAGSSVPWHDRTIAAWLDLAAPGGWPKENLVAANSPEPASG